MPCKDGASELLTLCPVNMPAGQLRVVRSVGTKGPLGLIVSTWLDACIAAPDPAQQALVQKWGNVPT
jgi:hypothetical protein